MNIIHKAVSNLAPGVQWVMQDNDYLNIEWLDEIVKAPTVTQIKAEITRLTNEEASKASAKADLLAKLGITEDEARLLLG